MADFVRQVGGDRVTVMTLMPGGTNPHDFTATNADIGEFDLVVWNGLGFDDQTAPYASDPARGLAIAEDLDEVEFLADPQGTLNPHAYMDPLNASIYVDRIRLALISLDPQGQQAYDGNADDYIARLEQLERDVAAELDQLPDDRRDIFVTHDGLDYFADAFGLNVVGSFAEGIDGVDTDTLLGQVAESGAHALVGESHLGIEPWEDIAGQAAIPWVQWTFTDSLGVDPQPDTYEEAMRHNAELIAAVP
jgi:ABC-type Zn uptake system ZnuABC Zn-binding protein ZnuA